VEDLEEMGGFKYTRRLRFVTLGLLAAYKDWIPSDELLNLEVSCRKPNCPCSIRTLDNVTLWEKGIQAGKGADVILKLDGAAGWGLHAAEALKMGSYIGTHC